MHLIKPLIEKSVWCKQYKNIGFRTKKFRNQEFLYGISFICVFGENKAFYNTKLPAFVFFRRYWRFKYKKIRRNLQGTFTLAFYSR